MRTKSSCPLCRRHHHYEGAPAEGLESEESEEDDMFGEMEVAQRHEWLRDRLEEARAEPGTISLLERIHRENPELETTLYHAANEQADVSLAWMAGAIIRLLAEDDLPPNVRRNDQIGGPLMSSRAALAFRTNRIPSAIQRFVRELVLVLMSHLG